MISGTSRGDPTVSPSIGVQTHSSVLSVHNKDPVKSLTRSNPSRPLPIHSLPCRTTLKTSTRLVTVIVLGDVLVSFPRDVLTDLVSVLQEGRRDMCVSIKSDWRYRHCTPILFKFPNPVHTLV